MTDFSPFTKPQSRCLHLTAPQNTLSKLHRRQGQQALRRPSAGPLGRGPGLKPLEPSRPPHVSRVPARQSARPAWPPCPHGPCSLADRHLLRTPPRSPHAGAADPHAGPGASMRAALGTSPAAAIVCPASPYSRAGNADRSRHPPPPPPPLPLPRRRHVTRAPAAPQGQACHFVAAHRTSQGQACAGQASRSALPATSAAIQRHGDGDGGDGGHGRI